MLQQFFSLHHNLPTSSLFKPITASPSSSSSSLFDYNGIVDKQRRRITNSPSLHATEKDSQFEMERDKAREALKLLDQELQILSDNEPTPPKQRISFPNLETDPAARDMVKDAPPDYSDSFFGYTAFALLMLTMLYNVIFITVIKPAIDGPQQQDFSYFPTTANNPSGFEQSTAPSVSSEEE